MSLLEYLDAKLSEEPMPSALALIVATAALTAVFLLLASALFYPGYESVIPNPLRTRIPQLPEKEVSRLEYKPDAYPGARDVTTPVCIYNRYERVSGMAWFESYSSDHLTSYLVRYYASV